MSPGAVKKGGRAKRATFLEKGAGPSFADGVTQGVGWGRSGAPRAAFPNHGFEQSRAVFAL